MNLDVPTIQLFVADCALHLFLYKNNIQIKEHPLFFSMDYIYESNEDLLGLIYISCKNIGNRKATVSYYTSTKVVKNLISKLNFQETHKILDPCCGTGNFLMQLPEQITSFSNQRASNRLHLQKCTVLRKNCYTAL